MIESLFLNLPYVPFTVDVYPYGDDSPSAIEIAMLYFVAAHGDDGVTIRQFKAALHLGDNVAASLLNGLWRRAFVTISRDSGTIRLDDRAQEAQDNDFRGAGRGSEPVSFSLGYDLVTGLVINPYGQIIEDPRLDYTVLPSNFEDALRPYDFPLDGFADIPPHEMLHALQSIPDFRNLREKKANISIDLVVPPGELSLKDVRYYKGYFRVTISTGGKLDLRVAKNPGALHAVLSEIAQKLPKGPAARGQMLYATLAGQAALGVEVERDAQDQFTRLIRDEARLSKIAKDPERYSNGSEFDTLWDDARIRFRTLIESEMSDEHARVAVGYVDKGGVVPAFLSMAQGRGERLILASQNTSQLDRVETTPLKAALVTALQGTVPRVRKGILHWVSIDGRNAERDAERDKRAQNLELTIGREVRQQRNGYSERITDRFVSAPSDLYGNHFASSIAMLDDKILLLASTSLFGDYAEEAAGLLVTPVALQQNSGAFHPFATALVERMTNRFAIGRLLPRRPSAASVPSNAVSIAGRLEDLRDIEQEMADSARLAATEPEEPEDTSEMGGEEAPAGERPEVALEDEPETLRQLQSMRAEALGYALARLQAFRANGELVARPVFDAELFSTMRDLILATEPGNQVTVCVAVGAIALRRRKAKNPILGPDPYIDPTFADPIRRFFEAAPTNTANVVLIDAPNRNPTNFQDLLNKLAALKKDFADRLTVFYPVEHKLDSTNGLSCVITPYATLIATGGLTGWKRRAFNSGDGSMVGFLLRGRGHAAAATQQLERHVPDIKITLPDTDFDIPPASAARKTYLDWRQTVQTADCPDLGIGRLANADPDDFRDFRDPLFQRALQKSIAKRLPADTDAGHDARGNLFRLSEAEGDLVGMACFAPFAPEDHALHDPLLRDALMYFLHDEGKSFPRSIYDTGPLVKSAEGAALVILAWLRWPSQVTGSLAQIDDAALKAVALGLTAMLDNLIQRARKEQTTLPDLSRVRLSISDDAQAKLLKQHEDLVALHLRVSRKDYGTTPAARIRDLAFWVSKTSEFYRMRQVVMDDALSPEFKADRLDAILSGLIATPARAFRSKGAASIYAVERVEHFNKVNQQAERNEELVGKRRTAMENDWSHLLAETWRFVAAARELFGEDVDADDIALYRAISDWLDGFDATPAGSDRVVQKRLAAALKAMLETGTVPEPMSPYWRYPAVFGSEVHKDNTVDWALLEDAFMAQEWPVSRDRMEAIFDAQLEQFRYARSKRLLDHLPASEAVLRKTLGRKLEDVVSNEHDRLLAEERRIREALADLGGTFNPEEEGDLNLLHDSASELADVEGAEVARVYFQEVAEAAEQRCRDLSSELARRIAHLTSDASTAAGKLIDLGLPHAVRAVLLELDWAGIGDWPSQITPGELINKVLVGKSFRGDAKLELRSHLETETWDQYGETLAAILDPNMAIDQARATGFVDMVGEWFADGGEQDAIAVMARKIQSRFNLPHPPSIRCRVNPDDDPAPILVHHGDADAIGVLLCPLLSLVGRHTNELFLPLDDVFTALLQEPHRREGLILDRMEKRANLKTLLRKAQYQSITPWNRLPSDVRDDARIVMEVAHRFGIPILFDYWSDTLTVEVNRIMGLSQILSAWHKGEREQGDATGRRKQLRLGEMLEKCFRNTHNERCFEAKNLNG